MSSLKQLFGGNLRQFGMVFALIILMIIFEILSDGKIFTTFNLQNLISGNAYVLILAIGMVMVIVAGHIDLSVGSVAAFVGIAVALAIRDWGFPWWLGIIYGLVLGLIVGAWQGFWVAYMGIPGFIVTLAGMMLFRGLNQLIGQNATVPVPSQLTWIGAGYLPEVGPDTGYNNLTLLLGLICIAVVIVLEVRKRTKAKRYGVTPPALWVSVTRLVVACVVIGAVSMVYASGAKGTSFPVPGIVLGLLVVIYSFITSKTIVGRHVYAVGGNRNAAELSGVKSRRVNFLVMMNMSFLASVAAIVFIGRSTSSGPFDGTGWELDAIAAVFIGGAAVSGGIGTVFGSLIGGLVMAVLNNGLQALSVGADLTQIIKGLVLLLAVAIDVYNKQQGRASLIGMMMKNFNKKKGEPVELPEPAAVPAAAEETTSVK